MRSRSRSRKFLLGVTGGLGSGKSLACNFLHQAGCKVYYADSIAKQLYKKNKALKKKLIETFGTGLLDNRKVISPLKLRRLVFVSKPNQRRVGRIVHPFVISEINKRIKQNSNDYIVIEAALI